MKQITRTTALVHPSSTINKPRRSAPTSERWVASELLRHLRRDLKMMRLAIEHPAGVRVADVTSVLDDADLRIASVVSIIGMTR